MNAEIKIFYDKLKSCQVPEELFGNLEGDKKQKKSELQKVYHGFVKQFHPDRNPNASSKEKETLNDILTLLLPLVDRAKKRIDQEVYGNTVARETSDAPTLEIKLGDITYHLQDLLLQGEYCLIYSGFIDDADRTPVIFKAVENPEHNYLLQNEIDIVSQIEHIHYLQYYNHFRNTDGQTVVIYENFDGVDLMTLREKFPDGLPQKHVGWIFQRLLCGLGLLHSKEILHGYLEPTNILVRPRDHNVKIIDLLFALEDAASSGTKFGVKVPGYSPPEAYHDKPPLPQSDLYMLGKCMIYLLGGDVQTNQLPESVHPDLADFIYKFVNPKPMRRPDDAWKAHDELSDLRREVFGSGFYTFNL